MKASSTIKLVSIFAFIGLIVFLSLWCIYYIQQQKVNKETFFYWYNEQFKPQDYEGILKYIDRNETLECQASLWIKTKEKKAPVRYTLGCACENKEFMNFISVGDSVFKQKKDVFITFLKQDGRSMRFELPFCTATHH